MMSHSSTSKMPDRMLSRERVKKAISFSGPDHIPHYLPDGLPNDLLWLAPWTMGPEAHPPDRQAWTPVSANIDLRIDAWGVTWERARANTGNMGQAK